MVSSIDLESDEVWMIYWSLIHMLTFFLKDKNTPRNPMNVAIQMLIESPQRTIICHRRLSSSRLVGATM